jgi:hypothetical protein
MADDVPRGDAYATTPQILDDAHRVRGSLHERAGAIDACG